ncbi:aminoacyl--tRNA ligase-related protein [Streptococcus equi]|uniref:tRNA synthetase n=1 Tax=Streptococcus equi subsp. equi TaxID=148942 RepID=A0A380JRE5_9STRE|nr:aminoacyl--tRNA ligase-related protein [Streptococcus equi]SUN46819.1 tRNA synthetase [Streptococcus equi subsp. equi]HEL0622384.1 hypothetical protein [Streptococcus equi subsp. zooepidemicus]
MSNKYIEYSQIDYLNFIKLDNLFISQLDSKYSVEYYKLPSLISGEVLRRCGYFSTMPNQLSKVDTINISDLESLGNSKMLDKITYNSSEDYFLTPAACLHFYPLLEQKGNKDCIYTSLVDVFRYENGNFISGTRQWEFTVREFLAIGSVEFVEEFLVDLKSKLLAVALQFDPTATIQNACDNFYPTEINKVKQKFQKYNNLKFELVVHIAGKEVSIASFNYHKNHFSKEFNFDLNNTIVTGCVGLGIDRWLSLVTESGKEL